MHFLFVGQLVISTPQRSPDITALNPSLTPKIEYIHPMTIKNIERDIKPLETFIYFALCKKDERWQVKDGM